MRESLILLGLGLLGLAVLFALLQPSFPSVPFTTVALGEESGIGSHWATVVVDQAVWEALWREHMAHSRNPPPPPEVDFTEEMVLAVFGGLQPAGTWVQITRVEKRPDKLLVHYTLAGPACSKCSLPTGLVQPFHIIKVKLERTGTDLPVAFTRE